MHYSAIKNIHLERLWLLVTRALGIILLSIGLTLAKINRLRREFLSPLECGFTSLEETRQPVSLRFFIFAVIFVIFDVELILIVPFLTGLLTNVNSRLYFFFCVFLLRAGLFLEWNNKAFEWIACTCAWQDVWAGSLIKI